jgi:lipopolysaccharide transport system permease protein
MSVTATNTPGSAPVVTAEREYEENIIRPKKGWIGIDWRELVSHRELLFFLIWRDVKVKYKQAMFGAAWAIVVPLVSVLIYTVIGKFAGFANRVVGDTPYPVYIYAGLLPWIFLQTAINGGGLSLVNNQSLLSKIYLPRLFIPTAMIGSACVDFLMSGIIFTLMVVYYIIQTGGGFMPSWQIVFVPFLFILMMVGALGTAYLLSALTVMFRDLRFIIPFITQLGIWLTAVVYPQTIFTVAQKDAAGQIVRDASGHVVYAADYRDWLALNPFAGIVQGYRSAILGEPWQWTQLTGSIMLCSILFVVGLFYFKRVERRFADIA